MTGLKKYVSPKFETEYPFWYLQTLLAIIGNPVWDQKGYKRIKFYIPNKSVPSKVGIDFTIM